MNELLSSVSSAAKPQSSGKPKIRLHRWILIVIALICVVFFIIAGSRWHKIAALQKHTFRNTFPENNPDSRGWKLPFGLRRIYSWEVGEFIEKKYGWQTNRDIEVRIHGVFGPPPKTMDVWPIAPMAPNLGDLIAAFGSLTSLKVIPHHNLEIPPPVRRNLISGISSLKSLEILELEGIELDADDFGKLTNLRSLTELCLLGIHIDAECFEKLTQIPNLESLDLQSCLLNDIPPEHFAKFANLNRLTIKDYPEFNYDIVERKAQLGEKCVLIVNGIEIPSF